MSSKITCGIQLKSMCMSGMCCCHAGGPNIRSP